MMPCGGGQGGKLFSMFVSLVLVTLCFRGETYSLEASGNRHPRQDREAFVVRGMSRRLDRYPLSL